MAARCGAASVQLRIATSPLAASTEDRWRASD